MPFWTEETGDIWSRRFSAWGSMLVTASIFLLLAFCLFVTARMEDRQAFNGLHETIKAMAMIAVGFWLGSSNSKQKQDDTLAATAIEQNKTIATTAAALATSSPAAPITTTVTNDSGPPPTTTVTTEASPGQPPRTP